jgi:hypothetical protein
LSAVDGTWLLKLAIKKKFLTSCLFVAQVRTASVPGGTVKTSSTTATAATTTTASLSSKPATAAATAAAAATPSEAIREEFSRADG